MALPDSEWLPQAQRLAVGETRRVYHKHEKTPALVVRNLPDRWVAYCHRCHEAAVKLKAHAVLSRVPDQQKFMPWPADGKDLALWPDYVQETLYSQLLTKGIDRQQMLVDVPVWYSQEQGRLLIGTRLGWLGRATRGQVPKWAGYGFPAPVYGAFAPDPWLPYVLVTEDLLSAAKARWALRGYRNDITCQALLGTELRDKHLADILEAGCKGLLIFLDGDKAGRTGSQRALVRARGMGLSVRVVHTPPDLDPKDLSRDQLRGLIGAAT